jgi:hypothetical protein
MQRLAGRLRRAAAHCGCRTSTAMDVHGPWTRLSDTSAGLNTSMQQGSGSGGQSSSRSTRATFEDSGGDNEENEAEEIGPSQLEDAPLPQPS